MHLTLIKNPDESKIIQYKLARVIYAETSCSSLSVIEALASMISNHCIATKRQLDDICADKDIFECLCDESARNKYLFVDANNPEFNICLRVVQRMLNGSLVDACFGATQFHRKELLPEWAIARGYIADIDGLLFYL